MKWKWVPDVHVVKIMPFLFPRGEKVLTGQSNPASGTHVVREYHQCGLHAHRIKDLVEQFRGQIIDTT